MKKDIRKNKDNIKLCKKDVCITATGKYADIISLVIVFSIIFVGITSFVKAVG